LTEAQILLAEHLAELLQRPLEIRFEWPVCSDRRWRFDVVDTFHRWGFECNGHFQGKHGKGWSSDAEKRNFAQALGWKVFEFTNREVLTGKAKLFIEEHLLGQKGREG